jgi:hypothetical protein
VGWGLLLSAEKQDPIFRALRMLITQSRTPEHKLSSLDESVTTHLLKTQQNQTFYQTLCLQPQNSKIPYLFLNFYYRYNNKITPFFRLRLMNESHSFSVMINLVDKDKI